MSENLNEKLKIVAEYDGLKIFHANTTDEHWTNGDKKSIIWELRYHTSYDWQIPVWQKVYKEIFDAAFKTISGTQVNQYEVFRKKYHKQVDSGTPLDSFELLVQAIQFLNQIKNK